MDVTTETPHTIAETLRTAAAWLNLAADRLDDGRLEDAANMAKLGLFCSEGAPDRIAGLA